MAKAKIYKTDGTEDFDAESKELDDAAAPGLLGEDGGAASATTSSSASSDTVGKSDAEVAASGTSSSSSSASTAPDPSTSDAPKEPEPFGDLHGEVSELGDALEADALNALKDVGNKATPALTKLQGIEDKIQHLGDEVKARFTFAKQQVVNAVGALEMIFKRGK